MRAKKGFRLRKLGSDNILVAEGLEVVDFNRMISMNESAAYLWNKIDGVEFSVQTLADLLIEEYGIDAELAQKDASTLAEDWKSVGIVE